MMKRSILIVLFIANLDGCGDPDPRYKGSATVGGDSVLFACDRASCFSGTQYCLKLLNGNGLFKSGGCVNYSASSCKDRICITRDVTENNPNCHNPYFEETQTQITVTCQIAR
jgi:hypothetical protein